MNFDPIMALLVIANVIIGLVSIAAVAVSRIWTGMYETLLLWMAFAGAAINLDRIIMAATRATPGAALLTVAVALLMLNRYLRIYLRKP